MPPVVKNIDQVGVDRWAEEGLRTIGEFLTKSQRVLFAVALTAPSLSWEQANYYDKEPSDAAKIVMQIHAGHSGVCHCCVERNINAWQELDFIDFDVVSKLTDNDLTGILVCIDARNNLKKLKLTHCVGISGEGLKPLYGSTVLGQLDLSLVDYYESPTTKFETMISEQKVIPILDSIIDNSDSSLAHLQLPKKWRKAQSGVMNVFLEKYNRHLNKYMFECSHYDDRFLGVKNILPLVSQKGEQYGLQSSCYECTEQFCPDYEDDGDLGYCRHCEKKYCESCVDIGECEECHETYCTRCHFAGTCENCTKTTCGTCCPVLFCGSCEREHCVQCVPFMFCQKEGCRRSNCAECNNGGKESVKWCRYCEEMYCRHCRPMDSCERHGIICSTCHKGRCTKSPTEVVIVLRDKVGTTKLTVTDVAPLKFVLGRYSEGTGNSLRSIRLTHNGKIIFLTSSKNKTLAELGVKDNDIFEIKNLTSHATTSDGLMESNNVNGTKLKSKPKKSRKKKSKNRPLELNLKSMAKDDREEHSKKLSLVLQEADESFKEIRRILNELSLERTPPKQKSCPAKPAVKPPLLDNPSNDNKECKAGKSRFVLQVGEVKNLYKSHKPSVLRKHKLHALQPLFLDLHGFTRGEALAKLDSSLLEWINIAMHGSFPWVISVVVVCGGGNQILSEAIEHWIRRNEKVSNAPKNLLG